jgi:hypothetical protein
VADLNGYVIAEQPVTESSKEKRELPESILITDEEHSSLRGVSEVAIEDLLVGEESPATAPLSTFAEE